MITLFSEKYFLNFHKSLPLLLSLENRIMKSTIYLLNTKIQALGARAFFYPPATENLISDVEERLKISFPASLRAFYLAFNGGFFADDSWTQDQLTDAAMLETIQWNSNNILPLEDVKLGFGSRYPACIPVIHTHTQEFLVFVNPLKDGESAIYDAFHEFTPDQWGVLYSNFEELLMDYIEKEGMIKTIVV